MPLNIDQINYVDCILTHQPQDNAYLITKLQNQLKTPHTDEDFNITLQKLINLTFIHRINLVLATYQKFIDLILDQINLNQNSNQKDVILRKTLQNFWSSFQTILPKSMQNQSKYQINFINQINLTIEHYKAFFYKYLIQNLQIIKPFELKSFAYWINNDQIKNLLNQIDNHQQKNTSYSQLMNITYDIYYELLLQLNNIRWIQKEILNQLKNEYVKHSTIQDRKLIFETYQNLDLDPDLKTQIKEW